MLYICTVSKKIYILSTKEKKKNFISSLRYYKRAVKIIISNSNKKRDRLLELCDQYILLAVYVMLITQTKIICVVYFLARQNWKDLF